MSTFNDFLVDVKKIVGGNPIHKRCDHIHGHLLDHTLILVVSLFLKNWPVMERAKGKIGKSGGKRVASPY